MKSARTRILALVVVIGFAMLTSPIASFGNDGDALYKSKCAMCHGPDGSGKTMMGEKLKIPDLHSPEVQKRSDGDLKTIITKGKDKMPAYETKLSKEQIDSLVAYIRGLAKKP